MSKFNYLATLEAYLDLGLNEDDATYMTQMEMDHTDLQQVND